MSVSSDACRPGPSLFEVKSVSLLPTFLASNSLTCCLLVTPRSVPPQSRMASSICGGFLPITRWLALYPLPLPWLDSQHRNPLQYLPTFELLGRLVAFCSYLLSNPCLHVLSFHISTAHPEVSLPGAFRHSLFPRSKSLCICCAVGQQQECGVGHRIATTCFDMHFTMFVATDLQQVQYNTLQSCAPTHEVHSR